ncbi:MAG: radical SAM protein [Patescibacteria group bacterium]|nr:radical SAM protein [Patescibacteria group bacterium]
MYAIWNLTNVCPWNCSFCCMSAVGSKNITHQTKLLNFDEKMDVLRILASNNVKIDFSGGDPLFYSDDFSIVEEATKLLPKEMIDVSMTGVDFTQRKLSLVKKVGKVEVSIDNPPGTLNKFRPAGFNISAIAVLEKMAKEGIFCSGVTTLYPETVKKENLLAVYELLCEKKVPKWNILRYYLVGRGSNLSELELSEEELLRTMDFLDSFKGFTEIAFQHSLRILRGQYRCHAANKSIGILPDGIVIACGWALDGNSRPLRGFKLGKLPQDDFGGIIERAKNKLGYGECKNVCRIISYLKENTPV